MSLAALARQRSSRRILKVRHEVDELRKRIRAVENVLERLGNGTVVIGVDGQIAGLIRVERLNGAEVRRIFENDVIARIQKDLSD